MKKRFLDEATIIEDSFRLGTQVYESGLRPTFIVGLWRGGSSVGIYVQECLQTLGVETDHISLRTSYRGLPDYQNMIEAPDRNMDFVNFIVVFVHFSQEMVSLWTRIHYARGTF